MLKYKIEECAVCGYRFLEQQERLECPTCLTVYDLSKGKIDNSNTMVSPIDCKHRNRHLVQGSHGDGQNEDVSVCADCGEILVTGWTEDGRKPFMVSIHIARDETVAAVGKWARLLTAEMNGDYPIPPPEERAAREALKREQIAIDNWMDENAG